MLRSTAARRVEIARISDTDDAASSHKLPDLHSWQHARYAGFYQVSVKVAHSDTNGRCLKTGVCF